jgi:AhpD family alkylhydroperoxidase
MTRIPSHTIEDAPAASRPMLEHFAQQSRRAGRLLNLHAEMAHSPVVIAAYHGMRQAFDEHATLDPRTRTAIMLTASAVQDCAYTNAVHAMLAHASGWNKDEIAAIRGASFTSDPRLAALLAVAREAAGHAGHVPDALWERGLGAGWTPAQLLEAYASVGLTLFTGGFVHFAETAVDVPATWPRDGGAAASAGANHADAAPRASLQADAPLSRTISEARRS